MISGIANKVRNSLSVLSCPYHSGGIVLASDVIDSLDRLLKELLLCMIPFPHGETAAALKEYLVYQRRLRLMVYLSSSVSQMISLGSAVAVVLWKSVGYSNCSLNCGIMSF